MSILASPFEANEIRSLENPNVPISAYQLADIWGGGPTRAGVQVNERTALTYMAVYTAIKIIAEGMGNLPLKVYRRVDAERIEAVENTNEAYMLGLQPNDEQTAAVFKECLQAWQCLWGNGYARIIRAGSQSQLIALRSDRVQPERKAGRLVYRVQPVDGVGVAQEFDCEEIIHLPGLSMNGITGLSPIGLAREAIAMGKAAELFGATFYGNGTNVGGLLTHPAKLKPETKQAIRESWNNHYQGVANSHRVAILDEGVKFEKMGMPLDDAQFLESRKFQVLEIARLYRVPPHMLMDLERSTNNNIEQQSLEFLQYCLAPWLTKWAQEFSRKIFGVGSQYLVDWDITKLLMADMSAQQQFYASGRQWGYLSVNDIRRRLGLNPINGGDTYLNPQNMVPAEKAHALIDSQIAKNLTPAAKSAATSAAEEPDDDDKNEGGKPEENKARKLARRLFAADARRLVRKEVNALGKSAPADASRGAWCEKFYGEHRNQCVEAFSETAEAIAEMVGADLSAARSAVRLVMEDEARQMITRAKAKFDTREHEQAWPAFIGRNLEEKLFIAIEVAKGS